MGAAGCEPAKARPPCRRPFSIRERWNLGPPLTRRDAHAPDLHPVLSADHPRAPQDWPEVSPQPIADFDASLVPRNAPLSSLAQALVATSLALAKHFGKPVPDVKNPAELRRPRTRTRGPLKALPQPQPVAPDRRLEPERPEEVPFEQTIMSLGDGVVVRSSSPTPAAETRPQAHRDVPLELGERDGGTGLSRGRDPKPQLRSFRAV
jgi:hypothetical protein